jgi:hypothetical protein
MEYVIGAVLALAAAGTATAIGFDRERVFYPTLLIVIATYYVLFAATGYSMRNSSEQVVLLESLVAAGFLLVAFLAFKISLWLAVAGFIGHGIFDFVHDHFVNNPGVPPWWPGFCLAFDVVAGGFLAVLLIRRASLTTR